MSKQTLALKALAAPVRAAPGFLSSSGPMPSLAAPASPPLDAPLRFHQRLSVRGTRGRTYILDVRVDPPSGLVLSYRLRLAAASR